MANDPTELSETLNRLRVEMEAAAEALEFDQARRLRDEINLLRGGATLEDAASVDTSGLERQRPGSMGLGSSQQRLTPPPGWKRPSKPDPMTRGRNRRARRH